MLELLLSGQKTSPTFFWDFRGGSVPPGASFTRGSAGWYFDSSGVFTQAGTDIPRFEYDPVTRAPHGYLAERQSTNALLRSRTLDFAEWTKVASSVVADQAVSPDGFLTMDKVVENSAAATAHGLAQSFTLTADTYVGVSIFAKAAERSRAWVNIQGTAGHFATARFDLSTGTVLGTNVGATSGSVASTMIRDVGGGIYRIGFVAKIGQANPFAAYGMEPNAGGSTDAWGQLSYAGDGSSGMYFWGAQADSPGVGITSFIVTAGINVTRSVDILSLPLTSLPGWNASRGGVLVATYRLHTNTSSTAAQLPVAITDGGNNYVVMEAQSGGHGGNSAMGMLTRSGTIQINMTVAGVSAPFVRKRQAVGWGTTRGQMAADGILNSAVSGTYLLPVAPTNLYLGGFVDALNGTLESIAYYAGARPDAEIVKYSR